LQVLADVPVVALAPASVAGDLPHDVVAVRIEDEAARLETALVWRADDASAAVAGFREAARGV
jgi:hypothetical protein